MDQEESLFNEIAEMLEGREADVTLGKMMSSPGILYRGKNIAFYHHLEKEMVFKLGKGFQPESVGLEHWRYLNPFKNKAPMKAWFQVGYQEHEKWEQLAELALEKMKAELGE